MNHICPNNLPLWQSMTKPQQTNEHIRKVINYSTHFHLLNTIKSILTQNLEKTLQEESLWQVDFDNLYFWNTLNKTHQGTLVWNRNNRLHTSNMKHVYKGRKETTHERVGERRTYININKEMSTMYVYKWSQDLMYKNNVSKKERNEKIHNILTTSLKRKR